MLTIHRHITPIATVTIDEQTVYSGELMGMDKIDAVFDLTGNTKELQYLD